jgi:hypothetical protein
MRLAREFDLSYAIIHGTEGHLIAEELAEAGCAVMAGPFLCDRSKPETRELTPATAGALDRAGVRVAVITTIRGAGEISDGMRGAGGQGGEWTISRP